MLVKVFYNRSPREDNTFHVLFSWPLTEAELSNFNVFLFVKNTFAGGINKITEECRQCRFISFLKYVFFISPKR
jgi:hypothetical protein